MSDFLMSDLFKFDRVFKIVELFMVIFLSSIGAATL